MGEWVRISVGDRGYFVVVDEDAGAAIVYRSTHTGVRESMRARYAECGRRDAVAAAVQTALDLHGTATREDAGTSPKPATQESI